MHEKRMKSSGWSRKDVVTIWAVIALFLGAVVWNGVMAVDGNLLERHPLSLTGLIIAALLFVGVTSVTWWRNIDEAAREAHKWSWYWGGTIGLCAVLVLFILAYTSGGSFGRDVIVAWGLKGRELELGMALGIFLPVIGYGLTWGFWWWRRR